MSLLPENKQDSRDDDVTSSASHEDEESSTSSSSSSSSSSTSVRSLSMRIPVFTCIQKVGKLP
jgi:hypothetical protein